MLIIEDVSTDDLVDPLQIGWISYREGDALIRVKVIRTGRDVFLSHPTAYRKGVEVEVVSYPDRDIWQLKANMMLAEFRKAVSDSYYFHGHGRHINKAEPTRERL